MMRISLLLALGISFMNHAFGDEGPAGLTQPYSVVSDIKDKQVHPGTFVVQGIVKMADGHQPVKNVQVGMLSATDKHVLSDSLGQFQLVCKVGSDSALYFYKDGLHELTIENYHFKEQHRITLVVYLEHERMNAVKRKPVIYCYSTKPLTATVQLDPKGEFTFTYPQYTNGWEISVDQTGGVTDLKTGKNYPYLFWEATGKNLQYQYTPQGIPGFVIQTDSVIQFLENQLTALGLNQTEQTDFIPFWGPILQKKRYVFVQFLIDDMYESAVASLQIYPEPDGMRRVYILCAGLDQPDLGMPVIAQKFESFERFGFTVVEWGGSELTLPKLIP